MQKSHDDELPDELIDDIVEDVISSESSDDKEHVVESGAESETAEEKPKDEREEVEIKKEQDVSKAKQKPKKKTEGKKREKKKRDSEKEDEKEREVKEELERTHDDERRDDDKDGANLIYISTLYDELETYRDVLIGAIDYSDFPIQVDEYIAIAKPDHLEEVGENSGYYRLKNTPKYFRDIGLSSTNFNVAYRYAKHYEQKKKIVLIVYDNGNWKIMVDTKIPMREMVTNKGIVLT